MIRFTDFLAVSLFTAGAVMLVRGWNHLPQKPPAPDKPSPTAADLYVVPPKYSPINIPALQTLVANKGKMSVIKPLVDNSEMLINQCKLYSPLRRQHFLSQIAHETNSFRTLREYGSESYFSRYEGLRVRKVRLIDGGISWTTERTRWFYRLGNTEWGDGPRYRGRGYIQLTGRANYTRMGRYIGYPLSSRPELAETPVVAIKVACAFWTTRKLRDRKTGERYSINYFADRDNTVMVTRLVNGGRNGLSSRKYMLRTAKRALAIGRMPDKWPSSKFEIIDELGKD